MGPFKIDFEVLTLSAIVSLVATVAIIFLTELMQPDIITSRAGTSIFIFIGVFTAILIFEAIHERRGK